MEVPKSYPHGARNAILSFVASEGIVKMIILRFIKNYVDEKKM